jgi:predicted DNA-binding protein
MTGDSEVRRSIMLTVSIEPALQAKLEQIAQSTGKSAGEIVNEAISEHLNRLNKQRFEAEIRAFEKMYPDLKEKYYGQFVAIYDGQVVDTAADFENLFLRIVKRFNDLPVLIRQVGDSPEEEWHFRSPRLE